MRKAGMTDAQPPPNDICMPSSLTLKIGLDEII